MQLNEFTIRLYDAGLYPSTSHDQHKTDMNKSQDLNPKM